MGPATAYPHHPASPCLSERDVELHRAVECLAFTATCSGLLAARCMPQGQFLHPSWYNKRTTATAPLPRQAPGPIALRDRAGRNTGGVARPRQRPAALAAVPCRAKERRWAGHRGALPRCMLTPALQSTTMITGLLIQGSLAFQAVEEGHTLACQCHEE